MSETPFTPGRFGCPVCGRRFKKLAAKKRHIRTEHKR